MSLLKQILRLVLTFSAREPANLFYFIYLLNLSYYVLLFLIQNSLHFQKPATADSNNVFAEYHDKTERSIQQRKR